MSVLVYECISVRLVADHKPVALASPTHQRPFLIAGLIVGCLHKQDVSINTPTRTHNAVVNITITDIMAVPCTRSSCIHRMELV